MIIEKRFPANVGMQQDTFLNNKQIDGRLYVYLQSISKPEKNSVGEYETRVEKKDIPIQFVICEKVQIKSPKTYRLHFKKLLETGYLIDSGSYYILPRKEDVFFNIPLDTIIFFRDTVKEDVIKQIKGYGIENRVLLLSHRNDVPVLLHAMDCFFFPSLFEGLGIVVVEAQKAGVKAVVADTIPKAAYLSSNLIVKSLQEPLDAWVNAILYESANFEQHKDINEWDMRNVIKKLENIYQ